LENRRKGSKDKTQLGLVVNNMASDDARRRIARNSSGLKELPKNPPFVEENKRSLAALVKSPAERRSKSRGDPDQARPAVLVGSPVSAAAGRPKATSPEPPKRYHRQEDGKTVDAQARFPKFTPRLSPRGSLPGTVQELSSRPAGAKENEVQSWDGVARRRSQGLVQHGTVQPQAPSSVTAPSLPPSNVSQLGEDSDRSAVVIPRSYGLGMTTPATGIASSPRESTALPTSGSFGALSAVEDSYGDAGSQIPASISERSGTTTPTDGGDLSLLRLRGEGKTAQQVQDSRIMKLIGKRSVLSGASLYAQGTEGKTKSKDQD
jgi:hypothetical protein